MICDLSEDTDLIRDLLDLSGFFNFDIAERDGIWCNAVAK